MWQLSLSLFLHWCTLHCVTYMHVSFSKFSPRHPCSCSFCICIYITICNDIYTRAVVVCVCVCVADLVLMVHHFARRGGTERPAGPAVVPAVRLQGPPGEDQPHRVPPTHCRYTTPLKHSSLSRIVTIVISCCGGGLCSVTSTPVCVSPHCVGGTVYRR